MIEIVREEQVTVPYGYGLREVTRKVGRCSCGQEILLLSHTNQCECGQRYNLFGQRVNRSELG